jgi:hypothetical protein
MLSVGAGIAIVVPSLSVLLAYSPIGMPFLFFGNAVPGTAQTTILLLLLALLLGAPILGGFVALIVARWRPFGLSLVFSAAMILGIWPSAGLADASQNVAYAWFSSRSSDVIDAIGQYQELHGAPPAELEDLVPSLLARIPSTGITVSPAYSFKAFSGPCKSGNAWHLSVTLESNSTNTDALFYCPNRDYDLKDRERGLAFTSFAQKGDWVLSSTDLDD